MHQEEPPLRKRVKYDEDDEELDEEQLMQALEQADHIEDEFMDPDAFKRMLAKLEKHIIVNQDLRTKYAKEPEKFLDSEADLDESIRSLTSLSAYPNLFKQFSKSNLLPQIIMLLQHQNHDISGAVINFLQELVSATVEPEFTQDLLILYASLTKNMIFEAVVDCIERFNEEVPEEAESVHKCLSIIESMVEIRSSYCKEICDKTKLLQWLLNRVQSGYLESKAIDDNKLFATEILVELLQNSVENQYMLGKLGGIEQLLVAISVYRREGVESAEDREILENLFDALNVCLLQVENQQLFNENQGVELMVKLIKGKGQAAIRSLETLTLQFKNQAPSCKTFMDQGGLSLLFPILMGKGIKSPNPKYQKLIDESTTSSIKSMLYHVKEKYLERVVCKFEDESHIERLFQLRRHYTKFVKSSTKYDENVYLKALEDGQAVVENCDVILLELLSQGNEKKIIDSIHQLLKRNGTQPIQLLVTVGLMIDFFKQGAMEQTYYEQLAEQIADALNRDAPVKLEQQEPEQQQV